MQDVQNIPNPDVDSLNIEDDLNSHPDSPDVDGSRGSDESRIPLPPDQQPRESIEDPPEEDRAPVEESERTRTQIV